MKKRILLPLFLLIALISKATEGEYAISKIPSELLKNAHAVTRIENTRFEVIGIRKAVYYYKVAYTILNENGDRFAQCLEYYDKMLSVSSISGTLFDAYGKKIKSLKKSDIQDRSGTEGSLADDNRLKYHNFYHKTYPYTIEYEVEKKYDYTMFYPGWAPQGDRNLSVQSARAEVILPLNLHFRYKAFNIKNEVVVSENRSSRTYTWAINNVLAIEMESYAPFWSELAPAVYMGPVQFAIEGYEGNMGTWQDFGKFVYALKAGKDILPENIKATVHTLTDGIGTAHKKVETLYEFMQKNTRYISIQLGIGGWQPYNAQYVATNRYGDCKALTNYMFSLLKEAGIKSYYTLINAGYDRRFFIQDFPSSQFNHVILCVPLPKDTVWLECTSQTLPAGYLSGFTSDRPALLVDESGGQLVRTPKYGIAENLQIRNIKASLNASGSLNLDVITYYKAMQEDNLHSLVNSYSKEKILEYLKEEIDLPNYDVTDFNYKQIPSELPSIIETLKIVASNYAQVSGKRVFIVYNLLSKLGRQPVFADSRKYDVELKTEYTDVDSVQIALPAGYQPESVPKDVTFESRFGRYSSRVFFKDDKIYYYRKMEQYSGRFPAKDYNDMVRFYEQVYKADRGRIVLVKQ
ncbi:MAG: DUF3857 domain-containing protein [Chitinophagaceae bacterium]|nr:DUF3857 domain-containing protein [Chitinophagaceae bacterium]